MRKKLLSALIALSLLTALTAPAGAMETSTRSGESWRVDEEAFKERYMTDYAAQHREEYDAFDADAYYAGSGWDPTKEEYMAIFDWDEEDFHREMWRESLKLENGAAQDAYNDYIVEEYEKAYPGDLEGVGIPWALMVFGWGTLERMADECFDGDRAAARRTLASSYVGTRQGAAYAHEKTLEYREQYPGSYEGYDPDKGYEGYWTHQKRITMDRCGLQNEVEWKEYMYVNSYMPNDYIREQEEAAKRAEYPLRWPEEYAAFDERAWYAGYYHDMGTPESYMERESLDEDGFKRTMFVQWVDGESTGFFNGYCVTVDGTPIQFQFYRDLDEEIAAPKVENERILIPLRAAAEALGLTVEWRAETNQVVCANETTTVTFTLDSTEYSGGTLDAAPFAEKGVTYLPLRALGETLGCGVTWYQDFATAALTCAPE